MFLLPNPNNYMTDEQKKHHRQDKKDAKAIMALGVVDHPMNLPSLYRAVYGDRRPAWLTTGFDWLDKPHRVADSAMREIRALRAYILRGMDDRQNSRSKGQLGESKPPQ